MEDIELKYREEKIVDFPKETERKQILAYRVKHSENKRKYFVWTWGMLWVLVKYKLIWGMEISFTVTKAVDREEYYVQFYAE